GAPAPPSRAPPAPRLPRSATYPHRPRRASRVANLRNGGMRIVFQTLRRSGLVVLALATASASLPAPRDTIVIPAAFENADAFSNLTFPFGELDAPPSHF